MRIYKDYINYKLKVNVNKNVISYCKKFLYFIFIIKIIHY